MPSGEKKRKSNLRLEFRFYRPINVAFQARNVTHGTANATGKSSISALKHKNHGVLPGQTIIQRWLCCVRAASSPPSIQASRHEQPNNCNALCEDIQNKRPTWPLLPFKTISQYLLANAWPVAKEIAFSVKWLMLWWRWRKSDCSRLQSKICSANYVLAVFFTISL